MPLKKIIYMIRRDPVRRFFYPIKYDGNKMVRYSDQTFKEASDAVNLLITAERRNKVIVVSDEIIHDY